MICGFLGTSLNRERTASVYFLCFVVFLSSSALTYQFWFAPFMLFYTYLLSHALIRMQMLKFHQEIKRSHTRTYAIKLTVFLGVCALFLFLFIPRFRFDRIPNQFGFSMSGFSDSTSLDKMNNLLESDQVAMRVFSDSPAGYYRGVISMNTETTGQFATSTPIAGWKSGMEKTGYFGIRHLLAVKQDGCCHKG